MPTVLITGANRGIGLEFARQYAAEGWRVLATCRKPAAAGELNGIAGDIAVHALDVTDDGRIAALARVLADESVDLLINNAGIAGRGSSLGNTDTENWLRTLHVNSIAPLHVVEGLLDHLRRGKQKKIVSITSGMGSIGDNSSGGSYPYRSSKAALNAVMKSLAVDLGKHGFTVVVINPGWVKTDMGGANARITTQESVAAMRTTIGRLRPSDNGSFLNYNGKAYPW